MDYSLLTLVEVWWYGPYCLILPNNWLHEQAPRTGMILVCQMWSLQFWRLLSSHAISLSPVVLQPKNTLSHPKITHQNLLLSPEIFSLKSLRNPNLSKPSSASSNGDPQQLEHQQTQHHFGSLSGGQTPSYGLISIAGLLFGLHQDLDRISWRYGACNLTFFAHYLQPI